MNKLKLRKTLIITFAVLEVLFLNLTYKSLKNKPVILDDVKLKEITVDKNMFGLYLEDEDGVYQKSSLTTWPTNMVFNTEKSACMDVNGEIVPNVLKYENSGISVSAGKTVYCYVYFDKKKPDIKIIAQNYNQKHNTKTINCETNETDSPVTSYYNNKYQAIVFSDVKNSNTKCTLSSESKDLSTNKTTLIDTITGLIASGNIYEHQTGGVTDWVLENVQDSGTNSNGDTVTVGYRYEGKKPNNYIWFNNEMWRIIGVVPTCTSENCATKKDLVKIIRNESIGGLRWHTSAVNTWNNETSLYQVLNNYYLTKGNATGESICEGDAAADCDYRVKGIGETSYYGNMVENVYWNTGAGYQFETALVTYGKEILTQNVVGKIGIMNASDYGYATTTHSSALTEYRSYAATNWLYGQGYEWTITPSSSYSNDALYVTYDGRVYLGTLTGYGCAVRPVLYLKDSVYVVSGDGTEATPYQLAMGS